MAIERPSVDTSTWRWQQKQRRETQGKCGQETENAADHQEQEESGQRDGWARGCAVLSSHFKKGATNSCAALAESGDSTSTASHAGGSQKITSMRPILGGGDEIGVSRTGSRLVVAGADSRSCRVCGTTDIPNQGQQKVRFRNDESQVCGMGSQITDVERFLIAASLTVGRSW